MVILRQGEGQSGAVAYKSFGINCHLQNELSNFAKKKKIQLKSQSILQPISPQPHSNICLFTRLDPGSQGTILGAGLAPGRTARAVNV